MFFNRKVLLSISATVALSALSPIVAHNQDLKQDHAAVTAADKIINEVQRQLTKIRVCLNSIAALVKKNKSLSKKDQAKVINHFLLIDGLLIETLKNEKFLNADLTNAYALLQQNNVIIDHISTLIQSNFKNIASCNMKTLLTKTVPTRAAKFDKKQLLLSLQNNDKKLDELVKQAQGLQWYNHISRFFDEKIITPCQKYSIPSRALLAAGTLFGISCVWWQLDHNSFSSFCQKCGLGEAYNTVYGDPYDEEEKDQHRKQIVIVPQPNEQPQLQQPDTQQPSQPKPQLLQRGLLRKFDRFSHRWSQNLSNISSWTFKVVTAGLGAEALYFYPTIKKNLDILKNKLKGGVYLKEAERAAEKIEEVRFDDVFGQDEIKRYMQLLVDYLEDPETFDRLGLTPPKGILCIGDTRTGKTFCINSLFGEINDMLRRTNQVGKYTLYKPTVLNIQIDGMEKILRKAKLYAPCVVFIDEIDLLDLQRTGSNRTLSEFLTAMGEALDSKDSKKQVILIAATNRPETLDVALRQPGRFGKELRFEYPNYQDRFGFIKTKLTELSLSSDELDIAKMARNTENKSYEALNMLIKNAIIKARLRGEVITQAILDEALDEDIYHIISNYTKDVPQEELNILAAHFAGQALLLNLLDNSVKLAKVTIKQVMTELKEEMMGTHLWSKDKKEQQRFEYGKIFTCHAQDSINVNTQAAKLKLCKMYLAGFVAEELLLGSCSYSCHAESDKQNALALAQSIAFEGYDIKTMPKHIQNQKHDEALAIMEQCKKEARELLESNKDTLQKLSQALLEHKTLDHQQVDAIVKPIPQAT